MTKHRIIAVFTGLALWSTVHLFIRILFFFKQYRGLYFWSLIITSSCLSIRAVGFLMRWVAPQVPWQFSLALAEAGWVGMVTGFSIVLWSRLSIIVSDRRVLRGVLIMIVTNAVIFHSALVILQYGLASVKGVQRKPWLRVLNPFERIQISMFTIQEAIISLLYIHATYKILHERIVHHQEQTRRVLLMLFAVQTLVLMMDTVVIVLDLAGYFTLKAVIHSWVYGIKLELEFVVLNQLVEVAKTGVPGLSTISDSGTAESSGVDTPRQPASPLPSPDSRAPLGVKQEWWPEPPAGTSLRSRTPSIASVTSHRPGAVHPPSTGLGLIPEDRVTQAERLSLDRIGVIPDPTDSS